MARWSIPIDRLAAKYGARMDQLVRKITFEAFSRCVQRSPVDEGRFKANWNVAYGAPNVTTTTSKEVGRADIELQTVLSLGVGGRVFLTNSLPYGKRLEYGWSKQAPSGMVRLTAREFTAIVKQMNRVA